MGLYEILLFISNFKLKNNFIELINFNQKQKRNLRGNCHATQAAQPREENQVPLVFLLQSQNCSEFLEIL